MNGPLFLRNKELTNTTETDPLDSANSEITKESSLTVRETAAGKNFHLFDIDLISTLRNKLQSRYTHGATKAYNHENS